MQKIVIAKQRRRPYGRPGTTGIKKYFIFRKNCMLPQTENELKECMFRETARASYPGGMSMYGKGIVTAGTKQTVSDFFVSKEFFVPGIETFRKDHRKLCKRLSEAITLNPERIKLAKLTVAAKFLNTFLYQLMKFDEYKKLRRSLHLIIDARLIKKLKKCGDMELIKFLKNYPNSPYEATYTEYLTLQNSLDAYLVRLNSPYIKNKIEFNFLWAAE